MNRRIAMPGSAAKAPALPGINGQAAFASDTDVGGGNETIKLMVGGVLTRFEDICW